jgi:hypothetical protein
MAARTECLNLIAQLASYVNNDTTFTEDEYQMMLDDHATEFNQACAVLNSPTFTRFSVNVGNIDTNAVIFLSGSTTVLTETTDYTLDYHRGVFTTPTTDYRPLAMRGTSYNVFLAAADAWERIGARYALEFDFRDIEGQYLRSQQTQQCAAMAAKYRKMAGATSAYVERGDQPSGKVNFADKRLYKRSDVTTN